MLPVHDDDEQKFLQEIEERRQRITPEQIKRFEGYAAEMFEAFGMNMHTSATARTPQRFVKALFDVTAGYDGDPKLLTVFPTECRGHPDCDLSQVIEGPIEFYSLCEHHAFPFFGVAYVGYIAHEHIIGISKLTRLVRLFAQRFTVQERIGVQVADTLNTMMSPHGVGIYLEGHHLCTQMRGVRESSPTTRTTVWRGEYATNASLRAEFFTACGLQR